MDLTRVLTKLSLAAGVSGDEKGAVEAAEELLRPLVDETKIDRVGNLYGIRRAKDPNAKTILLDAHLDEVGLMVTGREGNLLKFACCCGGVDHRLLPGLRVKVLTEPVREGVITCPYTPEGGSQPFSMEELRIDCGLTEEEEIPIGTRVCYGTEPWGAGHRFFGKSLDDRACFASLLYAMDLLKEEELPVNVVVLGSVQEEETGLGAEVGTFCAQPDVAFVTDVTFGDSPDTPKERTVPLDGGAAIGYSPMLDRHYTDLLKTLAVRERIRFCCEVMPGSTGTNSMHTQIAGLGVPSVLVSLPLRYMHTPVEAVSLRDIQAVGSLCAAFVRHIGEVQ